MKHYSRELLVTTKVAHQWQEDFDQQVDLLMHIISQVDNEIQIRRSSELMDVYHPAPLATARKKYRKHSFSDKPFEFLVFRN